MELYRYHIKEGDTLLLIAQQLGLSTSTLKNFHNNNSKPHEWIREDNSLPLWSSHIKLPDSENNLRENKNQKESENILNLEQFEINESNYKILQKVDMQISGNSLIDSESEILWNFKKEKHGNVFYAHILQKSHNIRYIKSIYRQFAEYMQRFNKPLKFLNLELSNKGKIVGINNQQEIENSWKSLRVDLVGKMGNTLEEKNILEGGDKDFKDTLPLLKNSLLYDLFLNEVYQKYSDIGNFVELGKKHYNSQVFNGEKVNITTKRKIEKKDNIAKIKFYSEGNIDNNRHLKNIYDVKLKEFLQEEFNYKLSWSVEYHYDIDKAKMLLCKSNIKEQASSRYIYLTAHEIKLI
ncbi:hypothetical protein FNJ88_04070 [Chryseobacterium sp. SNU WT5]|uniref:hypothetical protein n=1 Tax=Chryseobacterium sp. SNU WT5 TaxID=2594269 RepID=UPI00117D4D74|nr:hypothetical protein [Chryseobacterium sp. SNU WT5]QDP84766.1 hypothetical protein FNJ88_04070 [Chryseobacterium sp. SNU WT5]